MRKLSDADTRLDPDFTRFFGVEELHAVHFQHKSDPGGSCDIVGIDIPENSRRTVKQLLAVARTRKARVSIVCDTADQARNMHCLASRFAARSPVCFDAAGCGRRFGAGVMSGAPKIKLAELWERTSANGNRYFSGFLGSSQLLLFHEGERDHPTREGETITVWNLLVQEREQRQTRTAERGQRTRDKARQRAAQESQRPFYDDTDAAVANLEGCDR